MNESYPFSKTRIAAQQNAKFTTTAIDVLLWGGSLVLLYFCWWLPEVDTSLNTLGRIAAVCMMGIGILRWR